MIQSKNNRGMLWLLPNLLSQDETGLFAFHYFLPPDQTWRVHIPKRTSHTQTPARETDLTRSHKMDSWLNVPADAYWSFFSRLLTWDNGDGVFLPGHHTDILLDNRGDEALEDSNISPHGALISHTDCIRLPEHWWEKKNMDNNQWKQKMRKTVLLSDEGSEIDWTLIFKRNVVLFEYNLLFV